MAYVSFLSVSYVWYRFVCVAPSSTVFFSLLFVVEGGDEGVQSVVFETSLGSIVFSTTSAAFASTIAMPWQRRSLVTCRGIRSGRRVAGSTDGRVTAAPYCWGPRSARPPRVAISFSKSSKMAYKIPTATNSSMATMH